MIAFKFKISMLKFNCDYLCIRIVWILYLDRLKSRCEMSNV